MFQMCEALIANLLPLIGYIHSQKKGIPLIGYIHSQKKGTKAVTGAVPFQKENFCPF